jgi:hypothetical protein
MKGSKKGGAFAEALWSGTAVFAALQSSTFFSFLSKFFLYSLVLIVGMVIVAFVFGGLTGREMFSVAEIRCPAGSSSVAKCPGTGTPGCLHPSGNCEASIGK